MDAEMMSMFEERLQLAKERLILIASDEESGREVALWGNFNDYFQTVAGFLLMVEDQYRFVKGGGMRTAGIRELKSRNEAMYEDIVGARYDHSYANPVFAAAELGKELGPVLSALYAELRSTIGFAHDGDLEELVIRMELFLEIYGAFTCAQTENGELPPFREIRDIFYWFASDYADVTAEKRIGAMVDPEQSFAKELLRTGDLEDTRYLYTYGEYISDNEVRLANFLSVLPQADIDTMADTFTEGYRIGFEVTGKDLSKKTTAEIHFPIGFERMARKAIANLEALNLKVITRRCAQSMMYNASIYKRNIFSTSANRQYEFDHKNDKALFLDPNFINRSLEVDEAAFEQYKDLARGVAGPALVESFGEKDFDPQTRTEAISYTDEQNRLLTEYRSKSSAITRKYIPEDERSFTIIAFPVPDIMEALPENTEQCYEEFFREIIRVNTLDYRLYRDIQATIIDSLNRAHYCEVRGMNGNETDLHVELYRLKDPEKETIFENCVADVNIPVGEVFTSPVLKGTNGTLHVSKVYLNGLEFRELKLKFVDGKIAEYSCRNFENEADNNKYIEENLLFRHPTLPLGEFAIGTNTTAYRVARKYGVESKLPILIAEKTGPHFAVGDTCYSYVEDIPVFNPDGKEIVARDNECSILRKEDSPKAYFNCHTDITIPYDELGELAAVCPDGSRIPILKNGRFVLPGTEPLNIALDE